MFKQKYKYIFMLLLLLLTISSCKKDEEPHELKFFVDNSLYYTIKTIGKEDITLPETPTKTGYSFVGWYFNQDNQNEELSTSTFKNKTLETNKNVYAHWELIDYQITYHLNGGTNVNNPNTFNITQKINLQNPEFIGHSFLGWYLDSQFTNKITTISSGTSQDLNLYAKFEIKKCQTIFQSEYGKELLPQIVDYNNSITIPETLSAKGYEFIGWYIDSKYEEQYDFNSKVLDDQVLYAKWQPLVYNIMYHLDINATNSNPLSYTINDKTIFLNDPVLLGYHFDGWFTNSNYDTKVEYIATSSCSNIDLYAKFSEGDFSIVFNCLGGTTINTITLPYNTVIEKPLDPTYDGAEFIGWYTSETFEEMFIFDKMPGESIILYAKWEFEEYTITYHLDGGTANNPDVYTVKSKIIILEEAKKPDYIFLGWYENTTSNIKVLQIDPNLRQSIDLYARYEYDIYTIEFNNLGSHTFDSIIKHSGEEISAPSVPNDPNYNGYSIYWYRDSNFSNQFVFETMPKENLVLYGRWEKDLPKTFLDYDNDLIIDSYEELVNYIDYAVFMGINIATLTITYSTDDLSTDVNNAINSMTYSRKTSFKYSITNNEVSMTMGYDSDEYVSCDSQNRYAQYNHVFYQPHLQTRSNNYDDFKINEVDKTYSVSTSEQLYYVLEQGYRPIPVFNSKAEELYASAKNVLRQIIDDEMTDVEKLLAIYDWLIMNITYDKLLAEQVSNDVQKYKGFYLEGVFEDRRAVCDGISKAFCVLARIEGIVAVRITGNDRSGTAPHAWNKVKINGSWFIIDATSGGLILNNTNELLVHNYFLIKESQMEQKYFAENLVDIQATGDYDYYQEFMYQYNDEYYNLEITSTEELDNMVKYFYYNSSVGEAFEFKLAFDYGTSWQDELTSSVNKLNKAWGYSFTEDANNKIIILIRQ